MCKWFRRKPKPAPPAVTPPVVSTPALKVPHPEEPRDPKATLATVNIQGTKNTWFSEWDISPPNQAFWWAVNIKVYDNWPPDILVKYRNLTPGTPAFRDSNTTLCFLSSWLNPGTLAHEAGHISWDLLTPEQQAAFAAVHDQLKGSDPLMKLLYSQNAYGLTNANEAHSEVYRYFGSHMPESLKAFYPKLIDRR